MAKEKDEITVYEAFLKMDTVISTLIPHADWGLRQLTQNELGGYASALDGYLEGLQREFIRRDMAKRGEPFDA